MYSLFMATLETLRLVDSVGAESGEGDITVELEGMTSPQRRYLAMFLDIEDTRGMAEKMRRSGITKKEVNELMGRADVQLYVDKVMTGVLKMRMYPQLIRWCTERMEEGKDGKSGAEMLLK